MSFRGPSARAAPNEDTTTPSSFVSQGRFGQVFQAGVRIGSRPGRVPAWELEHFEPGTRADLEHRGLGGARPTSRGNSMKTVCSSTSERQRGTHDVRESSLVRRAGDVSSRHRGQPSTGASRGAVSELFGERLEQRCAGEEPVIRTGWPEGTFVPGGENPDALGDVPA